MLLGSLFDLIAKVEPVEGENANLCDFTFRHDSEDGVSQSSADSMARKVTAPFLHVDLKFAFQQPDDRFGALETQLRG